MRIACALSLVLLSFSHSPMISKSNPSTHVDMSAYILPDGSLPVLCLTGGSEEKTHTIAPCEFCRISHALILPEPSGLIEARCVVQSGQVIAGIDMGVMVAVLLPAAPTRGPPIFLEAVA